VFFIYNAHHVHNVVNAKPEMVSIMLCGWVLYERNSKVRIAKMNIGLMSKMFSDTIKKVMTDVAETESAI